MVPLINIMLGEVIFGGVGAGLYGALVFVILAVFIAGLMVGRTPEYLGKKIESFDVKMAVARNTDNLRDHSDFFRPLRWSRNLEWRHQQSRRAWAITGALCLHFVRGK